MPSIPILFLSLLPAVIAAQETIVGVYIFHRHGDRTAKSTPPSNLTDLGYTQVVASGNYYRDRYVASGASNAIRGLSSDIVRQSQLAVSAPTDAVLQNSATGFLQGLYPPVGASLDAQSLRNGTTVTAPMNGYQLIPVNVVSSGTGSEDTGWLQASSGCGNAVTSSNAYFYTPEYLSLLNNTMAFYQSINPVINATFTPANTNFKNAYTIWDLINVAEIHNTTINSAGLITDDSFHQLFTLANTHEFNLAYNATSPIRAIAGAQLAAEMVDYLNTTITTKGASGLLGIQFGAYAAFTSFFGLTNLTLASPDFYGITDYASSMVLELFASVPFTGFPDPSNLSVRFLYHNGTATTASPPQVFPMFGTNASSLSWADFTRRMAPISIGTTQQWCTACGNTTGACAPYADMASTPSGSVSSSGSSGSGLTNVDAGVIGAFVTVGFFLILAALLFLVGGFTLVSRKRLQQGSAVANGLKAEQSD